MSDWKHKIVEKINTDNVVTNKSNSNYLNCTLIIVTFLATIFVVWFITKDISSKDNQSFNNIGYVNPDGFNGQFKIFNNTPNNSVEHDLNVLKHKYVELDSFVKELFKRSDWSMDRQRLMSILWNHNTMVIKTGGYTTDLILINGDWTIDRLPWLVSLTNDDRNFLIKFLKK